MGERRYSFTPRPLYSEKREVGGRATKADLDVVSKRKNSLPLPANRTPVIKPVA
jgi:hypothetical protein